LENRFPQVWQDAVSVIVHDDRRCRSSATGHAHHDRCARPFAGVVHEVAEHLVEVLSLNANGHALGHLHVDRDIALGVHTQQRPREAVG